jgi:hypothetical protein
MNFLSLRITAEDKQEYYNVQIPIFYGNTIDFSTEMLNGITTSQEHKEAKIFISIDDFQRLSNTELIMSDNNSIELRRNTVFIKLKLNDENSDLYLGFDENKYIKSFKVKVPTIYYKNKEYISLLHGLNVFSIDMNIIDKEDILNMISVNKKVDNNDYLISSIEYLDEKIFDFAKYPKFLQISQSSPFDKLYLEYNKNTSDYLFSWQSLRMLNDVTSSLGAVPSNFMSNYDGIFDFVVGGYDSDKRYYDILCTIINNDKSCEETIDFSIAYETITFLSDTGLLNTLVNGNDVLTFIISSVSDCMKATERTVNLIRYSEYQDNVLDKTILNSYNLKKEMMDDKIITDIVNFSIFNKYINNTYLASLYNNQYALYESANKLNKDIDNPIKNVSTEWYRDMIYKTITSIADEGLNVVSGGATEIPDILMKNIKYNNAINNLILEPSEALNNVKDCYFIQETVKNVCNVDIFNETENSYYNFKLMLQSSLTAYEILKENDTLMKIVGEDGQNLILEKINNINSILNNIVNCDITFYSTSDISNDMVNIKDISIMIVPIEDETNSTEMVEIEEIEITLDNIYNYFSTDYTNIDFLEFNNLFLACQYEKPSEIDLNTILYHGLGTLSNDITSEERETLNNYFDSDIIEKVGLTKISESELNDYLKNKIGLKIGEFNGALNYIYVEKYKAYYRYHKTDTILIPESDLDFKSVEKTDDNLYKVVYTRNSEKNIEYEVKFKVVNGVLQFLSNKEKNIEKISTGLINSWQNLYSKYLLNGEYKKLGTGFANGGTGEEYTLTDEDAKYQLAYIDNDDIPELIISGGYSVHIFTVKDNELIQLKKNDNNGNFSWYGYLGYREKEGLFLDSYQRMGAYRTPVYKLQNGECLLQANIEYYESVESGEIINQSFIINDEEVSLDDYVNELKKWKLNTYFTEQHPEYNIENDNWKSLHYSDGYEITESNINIINNLKSENNEQNKGTVRIEDGYLNVRESPSTKGKIIGRLYNSDEIIIEETSKDNKWLKVFKGDIKGYVSKEYIKVKE